MTNTVTFLILISYSKLTSLNPYQNFDTTHFYHVILANYFNDEYNDDKVTEQKGRRWRRRERERVVLIDCMAVTINFHSS